MPSSFVALGLRDRSGADMTAAFRFIVDELLGVLQDALASGAVAPEQDKLNEEVARNRKALARAADRRSLGALVGPLLGLSRAALDRIRSERADTRAEIASLVELVREAATVIAAECGALSTGVSDSLQRFEELQQLTDIHQLKVCLERDVAHLKDLAREREQRWQSTVATFQERLASLEHELNASREEASIDPLTGAGNRRAFDRALAESLRPGRRHFVVAMLDLDDFKRINDSLGHETGDAVLRLVADTLKSSLRAEDLVARIGGDEFALIISGLTLAQADNRLRAIIARLAGARVESAEGRFTVSCGVAECSAGDTSESLVRRADQALYDAKRQGKNRVVTVKTPYIRDLRAQA